MKVVTNLSQLKQAVEAHSSKIEQRLDISERRMEQLEAGVERAVNLNPVKAKSETENSETVKQDETGDESIL